MADYIIRVDSATKPTRGSTWKSKSGKSVAAWTIHLNGHLIGAGIMYYNYNGPNKTVYEGILAALSQLESEHFYAGGTDNVEILVDCAPVLNQLNGTPALRMEKHRNRIQKFMKEHPNVKFKFLYENERVVGYKKVDQLSKVGREWIQKMLR